MDIFLYILYSVLGLIGLVLFLLIIFVLIGKAHLLIAYNADGIFTLKVKALFVRITVFDTGKKKRAAEKNGQKKKQEKKKDDDKKSPPLGEGITEQIKTVFEILSKVSLKITLRKFYLAAEYGGEDAAQTALNIGKMYAAVYGGLGSLQKAVCIKKPYISIKPVYSEKVFRCDADIDLSFNVLSLAITAVKILLVLRKVQNKSNQEREVTA